MRTMFGSKFDFDMDFARTNAELMTNADLYLSHMDIIHKMEQLSDDIYLSIPDLHDELAIKPFVPVSKSKLYEQYDTGIVVGAGGSDCGALVDLEDWLLFDLTDSRMLNKAVGHSDGKATFNIIPDEEGNTLVSVSDKYIQAKEEISVIKLDSIPISDCGIISIDAEGSGYDIIVGALGLIDRKSPDLLISIYHNWQEYLLIPPILYDLGYKMEAVKTSPTHGNQPHLDLAILCTIE